MRRGAVVSSVVAALVATAAMAQAAPRTAFERYANSVVAVTYFVETNFMREVRDVGGRDLGVVVGPDLVMLNGSVVTVSTTGAQPHGFRVRFAAGEECGGTLMGRDEFANVAFLRLDAPLPQGVKPVTFDKGVEPKIGDRLYAVGLLPENLEPMVRMATGTVIARIERPKPFLVTDLLPDEALGGPVFTDNGKLVGILSELGEAGPSFAAGFSGDGGVGYGLVLDPTTLVRLVAAPPMKGEVRRSWLGITLQALDRDKAEYWGLGNATGIIVNSVVAGSPAEQAGLKRGDIVLGMNGEPVPVSQEEHVPIFVEQIGSRPVGSDLKLDVWRDGKRLTTDVQVVAAPKSRMDAESYTSAEFELTARELVFQDYRAFDLKPEFRGVLVIKVEEGGWSGVGGLEAGDLIQRVDDHVIEAPADLKQVLDMATTNRQRKLVFFVQRQGRTQFITVQPRWEGQS
jgi:S1-C subfamily serine protease